MGEDIMVCRQHGPSDAISTLLLHLSVNIFNNDLPIFSYHTARSLQFLTWAKFLEHCNQIWSHHGLPSSLGHSFCISRTTEFLMSGVPPDIVKSMGHWSSDSFLHYWRLLEVVIPLHAELLHHTISPVISSRVG
jgi:hypothetical protein